MIAAPLYGSPTAACAIAERGVRTKARGVTVNDPIHDALSFGELIQPYLQLPCLPANVSAQYTSVRTALILQRDTLRLDLRGEVLRHPPGAVI